jgi:hypothetical protein
MKVLHVTASHANADGGVASVVNDLAHNISHIAAYTCILAATDKEVRAIQALDWFSKFSSVEALNAYYEIYMRILARRM